MPGDTRAAPSVKDPARLRMATAGANWSCSYCGAHVRAFDGSCGQCGASSSEGRQLRGGLRAVTAQRPSWSAAARAPVQPANPVPPLDAAHRVDRLLAAAPSALAPAADDLEKRLRGGGAYALWDSPRRWRWWAAIGMLLASVSGLIYWAVQPTEFDVDVDEVSWTRRVVVERYQIRTRGGFSVPAEALDQRSLGQRHHHDEQVLDGYDTETYSEQVACGEDCTGGSPPSCYETCTPNGNGFATCTEHCSGGGGPVCTTRYCSETRTRQVPRYRAEPVYREYFSYRIWDWDEHRTLEEQGNDFAPRWPSDARVALNVAVGEGERERLRQEEEFAVRVAQADDRGMWLHPTDLEVFERLEPGTTHRLQRTVAGELSILLDGRWVPISEAPQY